jgi:hypothetical protein
MSTHCAGALFSRGGLASSRGGPSSGPLVASLSLHIVEENSGRTGKLFVPVLASCATPQDKTAMEDYGRLCISNGEKGHVGHGWWLG